MKAIKNNEIYKSVRKSWGELNPITRIVKDKTKYNRKEKFRNKED